MKTIAVETLARLAFSNSKKLPQYVNDRGRRKEWVGIGWMDVGLPRSSDVVVVHPWEPEVEKPARWGDLDVVVKKLFVKSRTATVVVDGRTVRGVRLFTLSKPT